MSVQVEFYGIPRRRAGVAKIQVEAHTLGELFDRLEGELPQLAQACFEDGDLQPGYLANVNGRNFVTARETPLQPGDAVLILSADAGGC